MMARRPSPTITRRALIEALRSDQLFPAYQPIVEIGSGHVVGFEALVRWRHPRYGPLRPDVFMPTAERSHLAGFIDRRMLERVSRELPRLNEPAETGMRVSVTLSAQRLSSPRRLLDDIRRCSGQFDIDPSALIFEVTETSLMSIDSAQDTLQHVRDLGPRMAVEHFGTGYSSLVLLKQYPIDIVKVDQSFVAGLGRDPSDAVIVDTILSLAHSLGLTVIAEGVEHPIQLEELRRLNCQYAQGHLWSRPTEVSRAVALVTAPWRTNETLSTQAQASWAFEPVALPRAVLDSLPCSTAVLDKNGTIIATSRHWKQLAIDTGTTPSATTGVGANYLAVCDRARGPGAKGAGEAAQGIRAVLARHTLEFELEYHCPTASGDRWFNMAVSALGDGALVTHLETTDRRAVEQSLRVSEAIARATFEGAPVGIARLGPDRRIAAVNGTFVSLTGRTPSQLIGTDVLSLLPSRSNNEPDHLARLFARDITEYKDERTFVRADGQVRQAEIAVSLVDPTDDHDACFAIATLVDVTDRQHLTEQLRRAQELEAVGRLAAGIAHEINTPVQFIGSNLTYLSEGFEDMARYVQAGDGRSAQDEPVDPTDAARIKELQHEIPLAIAESLEGVDRVASIVKAMKAFGHPDDSRPQPVDVNQSIANTLIVARNEYKHIADVHTSFGALPTLMGYGGELSQAFLNLIINATDAIRDVVGASQQRGTISIATSVDSADHIVVAIADTGSGIPPDIADKVFHPFFTTKEVGKGTGQGLSVVRSAVVERHRGEISFDSPPEGGTRFVIRLPVTPADNRR